MPVSQPHGGLEGDAETCQPEKCAAGFGVRMVPGSQAPKVMRQ